MVRVKARGVKRRLAQATFDGDDPERVAQVAARAKRSPRTITRILRYDDEKLMTMDDADNILTAAGGHFHIDCEEGDFIDV